MRWKEFGLIVLLPLLLVIALYFFGQWYGHPDPQLPAQ